ncbi:MAG: peptide deformylase [Candidatus Competibacteraceae bacterium]|jgi:peptide deformylase|nr:peptide deformylase [Candidatus Competibacteraceae bacterium]
MAQFNLKLLQVGEPVLRQQARTLSAQEIRSPEIQQLIESIRETMRAAPGVGLAAPQIGESLQLAVIEDRPEYSERVDPTVLAAQDRKPVPFHVIINPQLVVTEETTAEFFEGCLSLTGFTALVSRVKKVGVKCLNEKAEPVFIEAQGWYARILQHEIDHLNGKLYIDHMISRSFMTVDNHACHWAGRSVEDICEVLGLTACYVDKK